MIEYVDIGGVKIEKTAVLAPMAGVADYAYRVLCRDFGASYVVGEMVSAKGICYNDSKSAELCRITAEERPMAVQLFGSEPDFMRRAAEFVNGFKPDIIDINMGCPVPKVVGIGCGSAMMKDIRNAAAVTEAVVSASKSPVTVKIRKGWDGNSVNAVEFAKAMEASGASAITVHGRTRNEFYSGKADWKIIADVKNAVSVPVIGNGDVTDLQTCLEMYKKTGCDLVMIGRGSYGNPFVFEEIRSYFTGESYAVPSVSDKMNVMLRHIRMILTSSEKCEELAMREARKHAAWYMNEVYGAAKFRKRCYSLSTYSDAELLAREFLELQEERANEYRLNINR